MGKFIGCKSLTTPYLSMGRKMADLKITGQILVENKKLTAIEDNYAELLNVTQKISIQVEQSRDDTPPINLPKIANDDVVELEFEGGFTQWVRGDRLVPLLDGSKERGLDALLITPNSFRHNDPTAEKERGLVGVALKFFRVLDINPVETIAELGVTAITEHFEEKHIPQPGVYQYQHNGLDDLRFCKNDTDISIDSKKPVLLFIHGTFSSSKGSFGDLWNTENAASLKQILQPYGDQIFFLEHFTLSVSPVKNALDIVKLFPAGTCFHLISHSRGGLVGELLCQGNLKRRTADSDGEFLETDIIFSEQELAAFKNDASRKHEYEDLKQLQQYLQVREITVERFVRVAAPSRGTLLASKSLEEALNTIFNVLNLIPVPQLIGVVEFIKHLLLAILKERESADILPGLESMMPSSPMVALLNRRSVQLKNELTVIAGEIEGTGFVTRLKKWISGKLFGEEHDFVVNTAAMYGGSHRIDGASRYYLHKGNDVSHFKYFQYEIIRERIKDALTKPLGTMGMFLPLEEQAMGRTSTTRSASDDKSTSLYFIPGAFGSTLSTASASVWMDLAAMQWGDFSKLTLAAAGIKADSLVAGAYDELLAYLSETHQVIPFAYDWRRSHRLAGRKLGERLNHHLDEIKQSEAKHTIRLLAHSSGGLVIKAMMLEYPKLWKTLMEETDCQVVMLGTPLSGSYRIVQLLAGKHRLTQLINLLENPIDKTEVTNQLSQYPGLLELLPTSSKTDYFQKETWQKILAKDSDNWQGYSALEGAKHVREQLDGIDLTESAVCYVAGQGDVTPVAQKWEAGELSFIANKAGDGFSDWQESKIAKGKYWFIPVEHGQLVNHPPVFKGILDLLQSGNTQQLSMALPTVDEDEQMLPEEVASVYPDEKELLAAALCFSTKISQQEQKEKINVTVIHGNLEHVSNAVVVGHYEGDSIVNAEHILDQRLNGRMRELHRLGMYPGEINTSKILLNNENKPAGAIVTGLGQVGKLTAGDLLDSYTHALLDYALLVRDHQSVQSLPKGLEKISLKISTLLVGSGFGGLQPQESIISILRAVKRANKALKKNHQGRNSAITSIEFVELYEDKAIETVKFLKKIASHYEYKKDFVINPHLGSVAGGNRRVVFDEQAGWWQRIQIEGDKQGSLRYVTLTNRARAEAELQATQSKLVDKFVEVAIKDSYDDREIGKTLFELLVPNDLKDHTHDLENLVLVLNQNSAGLPWELLQNRLDAGAEPISVGSGMLRQLQTRHFREVVINPGKRTALVVGNPPTQHFSDLKAATREAKKVSKQLIQQGFEVNSQIGTNAHAILNALHTSDYRVLHLAGHGVFNYDKNGTYKEPVAGMVLGDDLFLTPIEIRQMRKVPEFAFINCCHLGRIDTDPKEASDNRHKLAANLAAELINMGVRAIVAAGWAINDSAAELFSTTFYQCLLKGLPFGESVMEARRQTYFNFKTSNTWGAYQCYGDPDYVLTHHAANDTSNTVVKANPFYFVSENEVLTALQNLSNAADSARISSFLSLQETLKNIETAIPLAWLSQANIRTALGRAHGKLDNFEQAIEHYSAAQTFQFANYPVSMLEDKVSLQTAWALQLYEADETNSKSLGLINDALKMLDLLDQFGHSIERWEERGKAWKRKAMISKGRVRTTALKHMGVAYEQAHKMALEACRQVSPYPLVNWQTSKIIRYLRTPGVKLDKSELIYWLNQAQQCADNRNMDEPSFCSGITLAECTILSYIVENDEVSKTDIVNRTVSYYSQAISHGAAPRQIRFVSEHLKFLIAMLVSRKKHNNEITLIVKVLEKVLDMLKGSLEA